MQILDEALLCVKELNSPSYHSDIVKEAIGFALEKSLVCLDPLCKLLDFLHDKKVLTGKDLEEGLLGYSSLLDDVGIDLPKSPSCFGEVVGKLVLGGTLNSKVVRQVLKKIEDDRFRAVVFNAAMQSAGLVQGDEIQASCRDLLS